jgi:hypothetical protein
MLNVSRGDLAAMAEEIDSLMREENQKGKSPLVTEDD